jgi:hypothetical protein
MTTDLMGGSFLATLELKNGTKLGFSSAVEGEDGKFKAEPQDCLYASTLMDKSLVVEFRYVSPEVYALSHWGLLDSAFSSDPVVPVPWPGKFDPDACRPDDWGAEPLLGGFDERSLIISSQLGSASGEDRLGAPRVISEEVTDMGLTIDPGPKQLNPWFEKSSEALWIGVDAKGCIVKTKNKESALNVRIVNMTPQFVYLWSSTTKNYLKTTSLSDPTGEQRSARMSARDGVEVLLKLRVVGVYGPDGEVQFT